MVYWTEQLSHAVVGLCGRLFVKYFPNRFPFAEPLRCHSSLISMRKVSFRNANCMALNINLLSSFANIR